MKTIHFNAVFRRDDKRVICWIRLFIFSAAAGLGFGGAFEFLRYLVDGVLSVKSLACESALFGIGAASFLLSDGLLKPLERLYPAEDERF